MSICVKNVSRSRVRARDDNAIREIEAGEFSEQFSGLFVVGKGGIVLAVRTAGIPAMFGQGGIVFGVYDGEETFGEGDKAGGVLVDVDVRTGNARVTGARSIRIDDVEQAVGGIFHTTNQDRSRACFGGFGMTAASARSAIHPCIDESLTKTRILETIDECIACAKLAQRTALWNVFLPLHWLKNSQ